MSNTVLRNSGKKQSRIIGKPMRILIIDIETRPNLGYFWRLFDDRIGVNQVIESHSMMCFAAKWLGESSSDAVFYSELGGRKKMVKAAWSLINEADAVVHYNGRSFDMKHLRTEFVRAGLTRPSPHRDIDLLQAVRKNFKFASNKLDFVVQELGLGKKVETYGFDLWRACIEGSKASRIKAMQQMEKYNIGDIEITEALYYAMLSYIDGHPNVGLYNGELNNCTKCGSAALERRGYYRTPASTFRRFRCKDCGSWSRSRLSETSMRTETRPAN